MTSEIAQFKAVTGVDSADIARATLELHSGDVDAAVCSFFEDDGSAAATVATAGLDGGGGGGDSAAQQPPVPPAPAAPPPSQSQSQWGEAVESLVCMGFDREAVVLVIDAAGGSVEQAIAMLT
jgi:hypothetical protein